MNKILSILAVLVFGGFVATHVHSAVARENPHRAIVIFEENAVSEKAVEHIGVQVAKRLNIVNGLVVYLPDRASEKALANLPGFLRVEEDVLVYADKPPGSCSPWPECKNGDTEPTPTPVPDPQQLDWGVDRIDADLVWATTSGQLVKVAVIDSGIDKDHPDLVDNVVDGVNFVAPRSGPPRNRVADPDNWDDDNGHGTHVAGTIASVDNELGYIGVSHSASLYGVKSLDKDGSGYLSDVISGIEWAINNDMDVINMSLGTSSDIQSMQDAVDAAVAAGIVVVTSAGNSGDGDPTTNEVGYPAKYSSTIAVAATASDDSTPYWSSEGVEVDVAAPGVSITSTWKNGGYNTISGTSMASPHVAGVVALMLADNPSLNPSQVRNILHLTAEDLGQTGFDNHFGYGLVDAFAAVNY